jgi:programmed cell death protein 5
MNELEEIRQRRLNELMERKQQEMNEQAQIENQLLQIENVIKQKFTKEALQRYSNIKIAYPEKRAQLLLMLAQIHDKIEKIDDSQLREILQRMEPKKRETKIKRI